MHRSDHSTALFCRWRSTPSQRDSRVMPPPRAVGSTLKFAITIVSMTDVAAISEVCLQSSSEVIPTNDIAPARISCMRVLRGLGVSLTVRKRAAGITLTRLVDRGYGPYLDRDEAMLVLMHK